MSADNGVYILKTGRQYRVAPMQSIDNLYWNKYTRRMSELMQPNSIIEAFGDSLFTYEAEKAINIALTMDKTMRTEYGVVVLDANKSWGQILSETKENLDG